MQMLRIPARARYALLLMIHVARHDGDAWVSVAEVARATGIDKDHLEMIARVLCKADLLRSKRGWGGGQKLVGRPDQTTAGDVFRIVTGSTGLVPCQIDATGCPAAERCGCRGMFDELDARLEETLDRYTVADLMGENRNPSRSHHDRGYRRRGFSPRAAVRETRDALASVREAGQSRR